MEKWEEELAANRAIMAENAKEMAENAKGFSELRELQKKNEEKSEKEFAKLREDLVKLKDSQKEMQNVLSGIGISNGLVAEDLIYNSLYKRMSFGGVTFDDIDQGIRRGKKLPDGKKIQGEFDVILFNGASIAIIDVKYRVRKEDIDYLIDVQMTKFKILFPQYKDFRTYLGLGGLSFQKGVERDALQRGIATLKLKGDAVEIHDENLIVY
jgi:hypothetical protein